MSGLKVVGLLIVILGALMMLVYWRWPDGLTLPADMGKVQAGFFIVLGLLLLAS